MVAKRHSAIDNFFALKSRKLGTAGADGKDEVGQRSASSTFSGS
jgi:hypothetical protein